MASKKKARRKTRAARDRETTALFNELRNEIYELANVDFEEDPRTVIFGNGSGLTQVERRVLIRSIFALVEAVAWHMKQMAVSEGGITHGERMFANDLGYALKDDGTVNERAAFPVTLANVRLAFRILAKSHDADFALNTTCGGWTKFCEAQRVRNRLTHPKEKGDLRVTEREISDCIEAYVWFEQEINRVMEGVRGGMARKAYEITRKVHRKLIGARSPS